MNKGNQKGITLIALIITIIVILILVAVSVSTISQSGLFDHAKDATNKWADEQDKEANIGDEVDNLVNQYVGKYLVGNIIEDYYGDIIYRGIVLIEKETGNYSFFEKAYIEYGGKKIDISTVVEEEKTEENKTFNILYGGDIANLLNERRIISDIYDIDETDQTFILVKDGIEYKGIANLGCYET